MAFAHLFLLLVQPVFSSYSCPAGQFYYGNMNKICSGDCDATECCAEAQSCTAGFQISTATGSKLSCPADTLVRTEADYGFCEGAACVAADSSRCCVGQKCSDSFTVSTDSCEFEVRGGLNYCSTDTCGTADESICCVTKCADTVGESDSSKATKCAATQRLRSGAHGSTTGACCEDFTMCSAAFIDELSPSDDSKFSCAAGSRLASGGVECNNGTKCEEAHKTTCCESVDKCTDKFVDHGVTPPGSKTACSGAGNTVMTRRWCATEGCTDAACCVTPQNCSAGFNDFGSTSAGMKCGSNAPTVKGSGMCDSNTCSYEDMAACCEGSGVCGYSYGTSFGHGDGNAANGAATGYGTALLSFYAIIGATLVL